MSYVHATEALPEPLAPRASVTRTTAQPVTQPSLLIKNRSTAAVARSYVRRNLQQLDDIATGKIAGNRRSDLSTRVTAMKLQYEIGYNTNRVALREVRRRLALQMTAIYAACDPETASALVATLATIWTD